MLPITIPKPDEKIDHRHNILSTGSCFTEHIGNALKELKFSVLQNPNGILFDPMALCRALLSYIENKQYAQSDLFLLNELWHSWQHHSRFSHPDPAVAIAAINASQNVAHLFLKEADWLIVTLGSAFSYRLTNYAMQPIETLNRSEAYTSSVANCHRAPAQWFSKHLCTIDEIIERFQYTLRELFAFNEKLKIIFTVSPVRHIRDGVVENNRSKARLIEAVHRLVNEHNRCYYFPSYELVIDVLRDYRFYVEDMVHPNHAATDFVLQHFLQTFIAEESKGLLTELKGLAIARRHRTAHPGTEAHKKFLHAHWEKAKMLQQQHPYLNLQEEMAYFSVEA